MMESDRHETDFRSVSQRGTFGELSLSAHFITCPQCGLPIEDDKYRFSVWVCDGVCTTVAIHTRHEGE